MARRDCAVVICTRNRPEQLESCLQALSRQTHPPSEILVVDNAPSDFRTQQVASRWGATCVVEPVAGLSRARNRGARSCRSEIIAFLDDDCCPQPGWLEAMAAEFDSPNTAVVTGKILPGLDTDSARLWASVGGYEPGFRERRVLDRNSPHWFELANFGGAGDGCNMAFRRSIFNTWSGFDERLGRGAPIDGNEEHYAFFQLLEHGYALVYTPEAMVRHACPDTLSKLRLYHLEQVRASVAFMALLFVENPRYRWKVLKYVIEALVGARRVWRELGTQRQRITSRWSAASHAISGIGLYLALGRQQAFRVPDHKLSPQTSTGSSPGTSSAWADTRPNY